MKHTVTLGFSPCPNDCFIFDALIHKKIDTKNYEFIPIIEDVETLNGKALRAYLDVTKLSYHAYLYCKNNYVYLNSGSALGFGCGPLIVTHSEDILHRFSNIEYRKYLKALIPGELTTAHFLIKKFYPEIQNKIYILFSDIENTLLTKEFDIGIIIHENRFTYHEKGLLKIIDLGEMWEKQTSLPIPLGGIMAQKKLGKAAICEIEQLIQESALYARHHPESVIPFVKQHAQTMSEEVMKQHIELYVNEYTIDLGDVGKKAVEIFCSEQI